jgi:hypothetical protein
MDGGATGSGSQKKMFLNSWRGSVRTVKAEGIISISENGCGRETM